ncbi:hypothetical protein AGLY_016762 [Aphis glycines]|uniref:Uncharacterized protein n=1 Tax=Aphis glycines TaxID=307491 RepID=A0A6G0SWM9_APHGL|nr:hypothetical protein AGLY_016762 [Aphis glycines]
MFAALHIRGIVNQHFSRQGNKGNLYCAVSHNIKNQFSHSMSGLSSFCNTIGGVAKSINRMDRNIFTYYSFFEKEYYEEFSYTLLICFSNIGFFYKNSHNLDCAHCPQHRVKSGASYGIDYCCMVTDLFSFILLFICFISQRKNYIGYHLIVLSYQDRCHDTIIERTSNLLKIRDAEDVPKALYFALFLFFFYRGQVGTGLLYIRSVSEGELNLNAMIAKLMENRVLNFQLLAI